MRKLLVSLAVLALLTCISGGVLGARVMRVGHEGSTESLDHIALLKFAELVEAKTNGEITVKIFPMNQLGSFFTQLQNLKQGLQEGHVNGLGFPGHLVPEFFLFNTAFALRGFDENARVINGPAGQEIRAKLIKDHGIRLISVGGWRRGARQLLSKKPIRSVEDVKGLKIRVPETPSYIAAWEAVGASPTPVAFGEVYLALQQGVVDAMECPLDLIYAQKFYECAKYISLTSHLAELLALGVNEKFYQSLTPAQQRALEEAAAEAGAYNKEMVDKLQEEYMEKMKAAGVTFIEVDKDAFWAKGQRAPYVLEEKGIWPKGFYDRVLKSLN
ncbi:MAG: TRAP transporter substrate-binding protein [Firmicutes bacterium]|jgi:tripartite ATP-independent transporter DctP family solute receptor|nr:TRAP transporter substrate-binding protein [Bacillota bacterium]